MNYFLVLVSSIVSLSVMCLADPLPDESQLRELLLNRDGNYNAFPDWIDDPRVLKEVMKTGYLQKAKENSNVRKRVFCNGFFGCGNGKHRKRASPPIQEEKLANRLYDDADESLKNKRLFCNSWGCNNGKRSLIDTLMERLNENSDSADKLREQEKMTETVERILTELGNMPDLSRQNLIKAIKQMTSITLDLPQSSIPDCEGPCQTINLSDKDKQELKAIPQKLGLFLLQVINKLNNTSKNDKRVLSRYRIYSKNKNSTDKRAPGFLYPQMSTNKRAPGFLYPEISTDKRAPEFLYPGMSTDKRAPGFLYPLTDKRAPEFLYPGMSTDKRAPGFLYPLTDKRAPGFLYPLTDKRAPGFLYPVMTADKRAPGFLFPLTDKRAPGFLYPVMTADKRAPGFLYPVMTADKRAPGFLYPVMSTDKRAPGFLFPLTHKRNPGFLFESNSNLNPNILDLQALPEAPKHLKEFPFLARRHQRKNQLLRLSSDNLYSEKADDKKLLGLRVSAQSEYSINPQSVGNLDKTPGALMSEIKDVLPLRSYQSPWQQNLGNLDKTSGALMSRIKDVLPLRSYQSPWQQYLGNLDKTSGALMSRIKDVLPLQSYQSPWQQNTNLPLGSGQDTILGKLLRDFGNFEKDESKRAGPRLSYPNSGKRLAAANFSKPKSIIKTINTTDKKWACPGFSFCQENSNDRRISTLNKRSIQDIKQERGEKPRYMEIRNTKLNEPASKNADSLNSNTDQSKILTYKTDKSATTSKNSEEQNKENDNTENDEKKNKKCGESQEDCVGR